MGTSLADQLRRLALPQTSLLLQDQKRPSLLFDPKEAANLNRESFYELGLSGLQELINLNRSFEDFDRTLFDISSLSHERSVESKESNNKLDKHIRKFLLLLSPYFLLKPAHKALEWLINRFHIHIYNIDSLVMLALPYHETSMFVRVIQLLDISDPGSRWHWLVGLQKPGVRLAKSVLLKRCSRDVAMLKIICDTTVAAIKAHKSEAGALATMFAFYCTAVVGTLEKSKLVTELQITHLMKSLLKGLSSNIPEFNAAALMITAQISRRSQLSQELLFNIICIVVKNNSITSLSSERILLLVVMYQQQQALRHSFPRPAVGNLSLLLSALGELAQSGVDLMPLLTPTLGEAVRAAQESAGEDGTQFQQLADSLVANVGLTEEDAMSIIRCVLDAVDAKCLKTSEWLVWFSSLLNRLERQYPTSFDSVAKQVLSSDTLKSQRAALIASLGFMDNKRDNTQVYIKLQDANAMIRLEAVKHLQNNYSSVKGKQLAESLLARLNDDSPEVVQAVLNFPPATLIELFGATEFSEQLLLLLAKCWCLGRAWNKIAQPILTNICAVKMSDSRLVNTKIFLAVFPYLFPSTKSELTLTDAILNSTYGKDNGFLTSLRKLRQTCETFSDTCSATCKLLESKELLPTNSDILEVYTNTKIGARTPTFVFLATVLTALSLQENSSWESNAVIVQLLLDALQSGKVVYSQKKSNVKNGNASMASFLETVKQGNFPHDGLIYCLTLFIQHTAIPNEQIKARWFPMPESGLASSFAVQLFDQLLIGSSQIDKPNVYYATCLSSFFQRYLPEIESQAKFLCHISISEITNVVTPELQVRSLLMLSALLSDSDCLLDAINFSSTITISLIIAASSKLHAIRVAALKCMSVLRKKITSNSDANFIHIIDQLLDRQEELGLDAEQMALLMYTSLSPDSAVQSLVKKARQPFMDKSLDALLDTIADNRTPIHVTVALLSILQHVNSPLVLQRLVPLGKRLLLGEMSLQGCEALQRILAHFTAEQSNGFQHEETLNFMLMAINAHQKCITRVGLLTSPSVFALDVISRDQFDMADSDVQCQLFGTVLAVCTDTDLPAVVASAGKLVKRVTLDARMVVRHLEEMRDEKNPEATPAPGKKVRNIRRFISTAPSMELLHTTSWRRGITLLEMIQNKKKMSSVEVLLPPLFDILKKCLQFEEQAPVEYTKQLLLSCLLHCCQKISLDAAGSPVTQQVADLCNVEPVVECIRASQNPQTHHHALLVLAHFAVMCPERVLHNVMAIFTFIGSSVLRQDDAYSFQVIAKVVDTVIPIIVHSADALASPNIHLTNAVCAVLRVFVDALLDIPEHRRLPLFEKLLVTLDCERSLWLLLCLVLESHVEHTSSDQKRQEFALQIAQRCTPDTVAKSCVFIMEYLTVLPADKEENICKEQNKVCSKSNPELDGLLGLFDIERHTAKQLRHFKYLLTTFLSSLLSSPSFVSQVSALDNNQTKIMELDYRRMIESMLNYVAATSREADASSGKPTAKYWRVMLNQGYDILDKVNALLPGTMFLAVIRGLLDHPLLTVRRKAMELLNARLHNQTDFFSSVDPQAVFQILPHIVSIVHSIQEPAKEPSTENELNQQTALLSVKLLAHRLAGDHPARFTDVFQLVVTLTSSNLPRGNLLASVVLCLAEFCSSLKQYAIVGLAKFMPALVKLLDKQKLIESPDMVVLSIVTAVDKVVEALAHFLSPYLGKLLYSVAVLSTRWPTQTAEGHKGAAPVLHKLKSVSQKLATNIPPRVLVPAIEQCYSKLLMRGDFAAIGPLLGILSECFSGVSGADLTQLQPELVSFFIRALSFRCDCDPAKVDLAFMLDIEGHIISALVALVLKLSETSFRPFYYSLFHWATEAGASKDRTITFYRLSSHIAESLKGLFVLFAGHFLKNAASLLISNNSTETDTPFFSSDASDVAERKADLLIGYILETLHLVFLHDTVNFVNKERFDTLMKPIVNQLDNYVGGNDALSRRSANVVTPCIAQLAVATADDVLWKQLNYHVLLKARHNLPQVRLSALATLCAVARKLGDDFLPILPETIPFLAELLEDEEEDIERAAQRSIHDLEEVLGEPLQKYF